MGLDYLNHVVVHRNFITSTERDKLYNFAVSKFQAGYFVPDKYDFEQSEQNLLAVSKQLRHTLDIHPVDIFNSDDILKVIVDRAIATMQISQFKSYSIDPLLGWLIAIIQPGGFIQTHIDPYDKMERLPVRFKNCRHVRFNVMVNRGDDITYSPVIRRKTIDVRQCDAWCFPPDRIAHSLPHIQGTEPRIVYQFGFAVDTSNI